MRGNSKAFTLIELMATVAIATVASVGIGFAVKECLTYIIGPGHVINESIAYPLTPSRVQAGHFNQILSRVSQVDATATSFLAVDRPAVNPVPFVLNQGNWSVLNEPFATTYDPTLLGNVLDTELPSLHYEPGGSGFTIFFMGVGDNVAASLTAMAKTSSDGIHRVYMYEFADYESLEVVTCKFAEPLAYAQPAPNFSLSGSVFSAQLPSPVDRYASRRANNTVLSTTPRTFTGVAVSLNR